MRQIRFIKLFVFIFFVAGGAFILLTNNFIDRSAEAFSSGPPVSFTGAPGEFRCDECHVFDGAPSGAIMIGAPSSYVPGQTYQMTVTVSNSSPTRRRWGFQLTAIDDSGVRAGTLESLNDGLTQVIAGTVFGAMRQYIEHTSAGTFNGQSNSATWTFRWLAPATNVGPVTFYAAGNGANGNNNSSGDSINFTFVSALPAAIEFSAGNYRASETNALAFVSVTRTGDTSGAATIDYQTVDNAAAVRCDDTTTLPGVAFARCDYATAIDTLTFAPGETSKTFNVSVINDAHVEPSESVSLRLFNPSGAALGTNDTATLTISDNDAAGAPNPVLASPFFVRQQYLDFLSREPEPNGFNAWLSVLNNCPDVFNFDPNNSSAQCDRLLVSSSFFRSQEFQLKGYFVYLFYKATLGRLPLYSEIIPDMRSVTGATAEEVFAKRDAFARAWTNRPEFAARYPVTLADAAFVDNILATAGVALTTPDPLSGVTRNSLVADLQSRAKTRAEVVRLIVESREVDAREYNGAFVAMQYFGYLRRDPETAGYQAWLNYLNANPQDFRTMVNGFMNSIEYRLRFGTP